MATPVDDGAQQVGERIRATRHARGLTLVQLAELCELSHSFLSQLERGHARADASQCLQSGADLFAGRDGALCRNAARSPGT